MKRPGALEALPSSPVDPGDPSLWFSRAAFFSASRHALESRQGQPREMAPHQSERTALADVARWPIRCNFTTCNAAPAADCGPHGTKRPRRTSVHQRDLTGLDGMHPPFLVMSRRFYESKKCPVSRLLQHCSSSSFFSTYLPTYFSSSSHHLLLHPISVSSFKDELSPAAPFVSFSPLHFNLPERNRVLLSAAHRRLFGLRPFPDH